MVYTLDQLIQEAGKLPPIPQAAHKALALIRNPEASAAGLARVISTDQVLAAQVLRWANSAYFGLSSAVVTVQQAIVVLGLNVVEELIMTSSVSDQLNRPAPGYDLQHGELWHHALGTAIGAKLISKQHRLQMDEEAYFAGLLCDIGKLVFERLLRETKINLAAVEEPQSFLEVERAHFGLDHAMLGAEIARCWSLPEDLVNAIAHHHEPHAAQDRPQLAAAIHVADVAMMLLGIGVGIDGLLYPLDEQALQCLGMTGDDLIVLVDDVSGQLSKAKELISPGLN
jgi:putative nucleotidyltransferase with HDIG domain